MEQEYKVTPHPFKRQKGTKYIFVPKEPYCDNTNHIASCTDVCPEFFNYPVDDAGVRIIPKGAICPQTGGLCKGSGLCVNGSWASCANIAVYRAPIQKYTSWYIKHNAR